MVWPSKSLGLNPSFNLPIFSKVIILIAIFFLIINYDRFQAKKHQSYQHHFLYLKITIQPQTLQKKCKRQWGIKFATTKNNRRHTQLFSVKILTWSLQTTISTPKEFELILGMIQTHADFFQYLKKNKQWGRNKNSKVCPEKK